MCIFISQQKNGTLYVDVTSNLLKRVWEHKSNTVKDFTNKYDVHALVWYEVHETMISAIQREKNIKNWERDWKINTIEKMNPTWRDLYPDLL